MTSRAAFGDFIRAADRHLDQAFADLATIRPPASTDCLIQDTTSALRRFVLVVGRFTRDLAPVGWQVSERDRHLMTTWGRAAIQMREALAHAAATLRPAVPGRGLKAGGQLSLVARQLESAASALSVGHDLLETHFTTDVNGIRRGHSEWAAVIDSDPVSRALMTEVASIAAVTGSRCARLAWSNNPNGPETAQARRQVSAASYWLLAASTAVQYACQVEPVPDHARELLHQIPVNAEPERPIRRGGETIADLCQSAIDSAERARRSSRTLARDAAWSPAMSGTSLRHAAAACTATSHHCEVLLLSLASQRHLDRDGQLTCQLNEAADAAGHVRSAWLRAAHAWDQMTTDAPKVTSRAAADAADMAHWTGRLAFADPGWTLARGPSQAARPHEVLVAAAGDAHDVTAAIHHALVTMTWLADCDLQQIQVAHRAGRLVVPTNSLDESYDIPHPFARAPAYRVGSVLATYRDVGTVGREASTAMDQVAATLDAPSQLLTRARQAVAWSRGDSQHAAGSLDAQGAPPVRRATKLADRAEPLALSRAQPDSRQARQCAVVWVPGVGQVERGRSPAPESLASSANRPTVPARASRMQPDRQTWITAMTGSLMTERSTDLELEP